VELITMGRSGDIGIQLDDAMTGDVA
jgi:hypothetical protein